MNWKKVAQLAMVHVGVSITVVPIQSTLNRILIADMGYPALWVSLLVAAPYLLSPFQVLMGAWADTHPIWGRRRSPWIVLGGLMASFGGYFTAHAVYLMQDYFWLGTAASIAAFVVWGMGVNIASVSYLSLVSELDGEDGSWHSVTVSVMWTAMILSVIITALGVSFLLDPYSPEALYTAFGAVWMTASFLVLVGAANLEPAFGLRTPTLQQRATSPTEAIRVLSTNPSAQRFFIYLLLVLIGIHAQDVLLEPYGAEVLAMPVAATSRLQSCWGLGLFVTLLGGLYLIKRIGKKSCANLGAYITVAAFLLIIAAGIAPAVSLLWVAVFVLGLGGGLMTISNLSFMFDMTIPEAAGLYMGAWGVANFAGQAAGAVLSGLARDIMYGLTGSAWAGYAVVFALEVAGLLWAVVLFRHISVEQFRRDAQLQLQNIPALAAD
jgi:BCD family chlorophyll transporter-like MFS transporter